MKFLSRDGFRSDTEYAVYSKIASRLLPYLLLLYIVAFLDRVNISFAKLDMAVDIGLSDTAYGLGAGIFFLAFCLFEIPSNMLLQRTGAKFWISRIMVTWGLICIGMAWVSSPTQFYVMRFLLGVAEAGFYPGIILYLSYWFPARLRGQATAVFVIGIALAGLLGAPLCGWIMTYMLQYPDFRNWQWLFLLTGLPAVLLGVVTWFYLADQPRKANWLTSQERDMVARDLAAEQVVIHSHRFSDAFGSSKVWFLCLINFSIVVSLYGVSFWLPQIIKNLGITNTFQNGLLAAIPSALAAVSMWVVAKHSDRTGERRLHVVACAMVTAAGLLLAAWSSSNAVLALTGLSLAMMGVLTGFVLLWTIPGLLLSGSAAAAGIALITTVGNLGGYVGPYFVGWIKESMGQIEYALVGFAIIAVLGGLATAWLPGLKEREQQAARARQDRLKEA